MSQVTIIGKEGPIVEVLAEMRLRPRGVLNMAKWVERYRPHCVPEGGFTNVMDLVPHDGVEVDQKHRQITDNELLVELAGRKCYDSFADAGAKRTNGEYLTSMWTGKIPHRSTGYHAKMSFFFAHVSRRVSHELIRNYVGSDRDEEGSPSQESTRFTHHPGVFIAPVRDLDSETALMTFRASVQRSYDDYLRYQRQMVDLFRAQHGAEPKGLDRKRIYEAASSYLPHSCGTSFIWTTNPMALTKFFHERDDEAADLEMCRFARALKRVCFVNWPNFFLVDFKAEVMAALAEAA